MSFHWFHTSLVASYSGTGLWKHLHHVVQGESGDSLCVFITNVSLEATAHQVCCTGPSGYYPQESVCVFFGTKSKHFQKIIGRWLDKPAVCRRLAPANSDQQQESAATSRARWWVQLLPKSAENVFSIMKSLQWRSSFLFQGNKLADLQRLNLGCFSFDHSFWTSVEFWLMKNT